MHILLFYNGCPLNQIWLNAKLQREGGGALDFEIIHAPVMISKQFLRVYIGK